MCLETPEFFGIVPTGAEDGISRLTPGKILPVPLLILGRMDLNGVVVD
jgi:hypothetical protein